MTHTNAPRSVEGRRRPVKHCPTRSDTALLAGRGRRASAEPLADDGDDGNGGLVADSELVVSRGHRSTVLQAVDPALDRMAYAVGPTLSTSATTPQPPVGSRTRAGTSSAR